MSVVSEDDFEARHSAYDDKQVLSILRQTRTIAMVGASSNWNRPSYFAMKYLQEKGYRVIPVNPREAGKEILGEAVYGSLGEIPEAVDMVDCFRAANAIPGIVDEAIGIGAKIVWMQLGIRHEEAARKAEAAGLTVIMDRCPKIEYGRLSGEIGWMGVPTRTISSKRKKIVHR